MSNWQTIDIGNAQKLLALIVNQPDQLMDKPVRVEDVEDDWGEMTISVTVSPIVGVHYVLDDDKKSSKHMLVLANGRKVSIDPRKDPEIAILHFDRLFSRTL